MQDAEARKRVLEELLYDTWILASESYKKLLTSISNKITTDKVYEWADDEEIKSFYRFI